MIKKVLKENLVYIIIILLLVIVSSIIMRSSLHDKIINFDYSVINIIKNYHNKYLIGIFKVFTFCGDFYIPCIILVCLLFLKNKWKFLLLGCSYGISGIITYFAKLFAGRERPIEALINMPKTFSFPSGHTLTSMVFYTMLVFILTYHMDIKKRKILLIIPIIFSLLIAFSRIYLGVHYFSDVIGGLIISIPCLLMFINIINKNYQEKI